MIRTPELKTQASMLAEELQQALGTKLPHNKALEIVARLNGFKNWRHAAANLQKTETAAAEVHEVSLVFGEEDTRAYEEGHLGDINIQTKSFDTEAEMRAYLEGVEETVGWMAYSVVHKDDIARLNAYKEFIPQLTAAGFTQVDDSYEFRRPIGDNSYQFIVFVTSKKNNTVNMDCCTTDDHYLTDTPLFSGSNWKEALEKALACADEQFKRAEQELARLQESKQ